MGKQSPLPSDSELMGRLREYTSRFHELCHSPRPMEKSGEHTREMSPEEINREAESMLGLAGEILEVPDREPLNEQEMLAIHQLLVGGSEISLVKLRKLYNRNKELAA